MRRFVIAGGLIAFLLVSWAFGQDKVDSLFFSGVESYRGGHYREALAEMDMLDKAFPGHPRRTASLLMRGKSLYQLAEYKQALAVFERLEHDFPESHYADDALYGQGKTLYRMNDFIRSAAKLLEVLDRSGDKQLVRKSAVLSGEIMDNRLSEDDLVRIGKFVYGDKAKAVAALKLGQRRLDTRRYAEARSGLESFIGDHPQTPYASQIQAMLAHSRETNTREFKLGVILPLSGSLSNQGKELLEGIQYALDGFLRENHGAKIGLVVEDSQSKTVQAVAAAQSLCDNPEVVAIIGELESPVTAAIAAVAQAREIPLIVPVASAEDLTRIGSFVFQINPSLFSQGGILARYAVKGLGLRQFAILSPSDDYGRQISRGFSDVAKQMGGKVIVETSYNPESKDLEHDIKNQILGIREAGLRQMIRDSTLILVTSANNPYPRKPGVIYERRSLSALLDSTNFVDFTENSIDAVFFPVYRDEIRYVIPEFAFFNFRAQILGGSAWDDLEMLRSNKSYVENAVFMTDFMEDDDPSYVRFRDAYRKILHKTPGKLALFGYDAAALTLKTATATSSDRKQCRDALARIENFSGVRGSVSFKDRRENPFVHLLQFRDDRIIRIQ